MDLSAKDLQQFAEADRREVNPPVEVQTATWSPGGRLGSDHRVDVAGSLP
jgi:hypothetical protein